MSTYRLKYYAEVQNFHGQLARVEIHQRDLTEGTDPLQIGDVCGLVLEVQGGQDDVFVPIVKTQARLSMISSDDKPTEDGVKYGDWGEFYTPDSTLYKMVIKTKETPSTSSWTTRWTGYITPDSWQEGLDYRSSITITARDNIGHLQDFEFTTNHPSGIDAYGLISIRNLVQAAMDLVSMPMTFQTNTTPGDIVADGTSVLDAMVQASKFDGSDWYSVLEDLLDSIGYCLRYTDNDRFTLAPLRHLPLIGGSQQASTEAVDFFGGTGEMVAATKQIIEEHQYGYEGEINLNIRDGFTLNNTASSYKCYVGSKNPSDPLTIPIYNQAAVYNKVTNPGSSIWVVGSDFYKPGAASKITENLEGDGWDDYVFLAANGDHGQFPPSNPYTDLRQQAFRFHCGTPDVTLRLYFNRYPVTKATFTDPGAEELSGLVPLVELFGNAGLAKIGYKVKLEYGNTTLYWSSEGWVDADTENVLEYDPSLGTTDIEIPLGANADISDDVYLTLTLVYIEYQLTGPHIGSSDAETSSTGNIKLSGCYARLSNATVEVNQTNLSKNTVKTFNDEKYNVIIRRTPAVAPLSREVKIAVPANYEDALFYYPSGEDFPKQFPYKGNWNTVSGDVVKPIPVLVHQQILCYRGASLWELSGECARQGHDLFRFDRLVQYKNRTYLIQSGTIDFLSGRIDGIILREFLDYDEVWDDTQQGDWEDEGTYGTIGGGATGGGSGHGGSSGGSSGGRTGLDEEELFPLAHSIAKNAQQIVSLTEWMQRPVMEEAFIGQLNVGAVNLGGVVLDWLIPESYTEDGVSYTRLRVNPKYAGLVADGFITSAGAGSGSGGGGSLDLGAMWTSLCNTEIATADVTSTTKIATAHLPTIQYSGEGFLTSLAYSTVEGNTFLTATRRALTSADIPNLSWNKITSDKPTTLAGYGITDAVAAEGLLAPATGLADLAARVGSIESWASSPATSEAFVGILDTEEVNLGGLALTEKEGELAVNGTKLFSNLANDGNDISLTIAGVNKKLTVGYATKALGDKNGNDIYATYVSGVSIGTGAQKDNVLVSKAGSTTPLTVPYATVALKSRFTPSLSGAEQIEPLLDWFYPVTYTEDGATYTRLQLNPKYVGMSADGYITSAGAGSGSGGGGGLDLGAMWTSLRNTETTTADVTTTIKIAVDHIPDLTISKITGLQAALDSKMSNDDIIRDELSQALGIATLNTRVSSLEAWTNRPAVDEMFIGVLNTEKVNLSGGVLSSSGGAATWDGSEFFAALSNSSNDISLTIGGKTRSLTVGYASSAGNAATLGGTSKGDLFSNLSNSSGSISITIGGTNRTLVVGYATSATYDGDGDRIDTTYATRTALQGAEKAFALGIASAYTRLGSLERWASRPSAEEMYIGVLNTGEVNLGGNVFGFSTSVALWNGSEFFSGMANSSSQLSLTIGGKNRTLTIAYATGASNDSAGNNIISTYATKSEGYSLEKALAEGIAKANHRAAALENWVKKPTAGEMTAGLINVQEINLGGLMLRSDGRKLYIDNTSSYIEVLYSGGYYLHTNIGIVSSSFITSAAS